MLVYKYRSGNEDDFNRDLESIKNNRFFAPKFDLLNDPCETLVCTDKLIQQTKFFTRIFGKNKTENISEFENALHNVFDNKKKIFGIYSLSKTYNDELLWAHYANSHKGFCIEFDLEKLLEYENQFGLYSFDVVYKENPPNYTIKDINSKGNLLIQIIAGYKSKRWEYEKEFRIVTDFAGSTPYHFNAVKGIYFGVNMPEEQKLKMIETLKGRGIQFYEMNQIPKTYKFERIPINDLTTEFYDYFKVIPNEVSKIGDIKIEILETEYFRNIKGTINIEIEKIIDENSIKWLANKIKEELFKESERVFIFLYLKDDFNKSIAWATAHFSKELEIRINGPTNKIIEELQNAVVDGEILSIWNDYYSAIPSKYFLVKRNDKLFMNVYFPVKDNAKSSELIEELYKSTQNGLTRYDYENHHGEYYIIEKNGNLSFYSENGKFKELLINI